MTDIFVTGRGILSPAGFDFSENWQALVAGRSGLGVESGRALGRLTERGDHAVDELIADKAVRAMDRAVALGVLAARQARDEAQVDSCEWSVVVGSSRGATGLLESAVGRFAETGKSLPTTSPATTAGAFPAAISRDLNASGLSLFVSSACSTGLHALGVGAALISSGQCAAVVAGGAEAALTPFTFAILDAAKVYARRPLPVFPCRPMHEDRSGLVLGEGAGMLVLEAARPGRTALARVAGYGAATERATLTGISEHGEALSLAIFRALGHAGLQAGDIDFIVGHGAGTVKGDAAELNAYRQIFGEALPPQIYHKWLTGHMLGASSAASVALAIEHLRTGLIPAHPYFTNTGSTLAKSHVLTRPRYALVTALGFGGNAAAMILSRS